MLVKMTKVQIIGTRDVLDQTVRTLHRAGVVQIEEKMASVDALAMDSSDSHQRDEVALLIARVDALLALLPKRPLPADLSAQYEKEAVRPTVQVAADVKSALAQLDTPTQNLARRRETLEADQVTLPRYATTMRQLMPLAADLAPMRHYETVALLVEHKFSAVIEMLRGELPSLTNDQFELVSRDIDKDTTAAILVFPREHSAAVHTLLGRESISQVRLPDELADVPFEQALATIEARLKSIPAELNKINRELEQLASEWRSRLAVWSAVLKDQQQQLQVRERFGATAYTFIIVGWMPKERVAHLREELAHQVGETVLLEELPLTDHEREHAPVVLKNHPLVRPFEFLVRLMALPRYGTIDPTPIMAIFLPIFFGMILGDVAYGVIVLALALYLMRRSKPGGMHSLATVMVYCSIWSILFGFLFGEFLGTLGEEVGLHPIMDRATEVEALFAFAIAFGVVQIALGFALGIYEAIKLREKKELLDRVAKVLALIALFAMVGTAANVLPKDMFTPSLALLVVGTVLLMYSMGWIGVLLAPIEILGTVGNILSYLRLAAIGLSSVYLALVANQMAGMLGNVIVGVIVAALFHALNIALGILSPTIQSLRLHYVEFFGKFFEGGGVGYAPFKREEIS